MFNTTMKNDSRMGPIMDSTEDSNTEFKMQPTAPGLVWSGLVWSGLVWFGLVWSGLECNGLGPVGLASFESNPGSSGLA
eukprot:6388191-Lingulodinium_polyedra.AAC.1